MVDIICCVRLESLQRPELFMQREAEQCAIPAYAALDFALFSLSSNQFNTRFCTNVKPMLAVQYKARAAGTCAAMGAKRTAPTRMAFVMTREVS